MPWKPGESGNPAGRPKGAKDRLSNAVIAEILDDWLEHGVEVVRRVREENPGQYLQVVSRLLPQNVTVDVDARRSVVEFSTAELAVMLADEDKALPKQKALP